MRVSVNITDYSWPDGRPGSQLGSIVRAADDAGIDTVWVADHLIQADPASTPDAEMLEAYTTLGFLAAQTRRVRLGTMVSFVGRVRALAPQPGVLHRLVSLVLLLRQRGRLTADTLARELEVTSRTVMRDIEALSAAGVPVYAERGRTAVSCCRPVSGPSSLD